MPLTLLYVEDCQRTREVSSLIFQEYFSTIILARDGKDALNKFKKNKIDIIITDIHMPKLNGIDMIKEIRAMQNEVSILVISGHNDLEYLTQSIKYSVDEYIFKPFNRITLKKTLTSIKEKLLLSKEKKEEFHLLEEYKKITDHSSIVSKTDIDGYITYVNDEFCRISGYSRSQLIGKKHNIIRHPNESEEVFTALWKSIKERKETWQGIIKNQTKNAEVYYVKTTITPILNSQGEIQEFIALRVLINEIIHPEKQLYDFIKPMNESIVILMKIEDFKYIDGYNHQDLKDRMQKDFALQLFDMVPKECEFYKIYLLNNGEFAIARNKIICNDNSCLEHDLLNIEKMMKKMKKFQNDISQAKINMGYIDYDLSVIISLAYGTNALEDAKLGLKKLLKSKKTFILANGLLNENQDKSISEIKKLKMIRKAIDSYNIISYFQPIIDNKTKKCVKYESLVRLVDEKEKTLSPHSFLEISKKGIYYAQITSRVLENSFNALQETDADISINLSSLDIEREETRMEFLQLLQMNQSNAKRVILEFTEDEDIKDFKIIEDFIQEVKALNVKIAIDDFGVGYSNFERVLDYHPDILKIDGRLIKNINEDKLSYSIVESIVSFAKKEHLQTIAEYVENEAIYNTLCSLGVDYSQGYYFGKPDVLSSSHAK